MFEGHYLDLFYLALQTVIAVQLLQCKGQQSWLYDFRHGCMQKAIEVILPIELLVCRISWFSKPSEVIMESVFCSVLVGCILSLSSHLELVPASKDKYSVSLDPLY